MEEYYRGQRKLDPKFKLSTPYGKVSSRKQQDKWIYEDETVLESLKQHHLDELIRVKEEVNKVDLKKEIEILENVVSQNGEIATDIVKHGDDLFINMETA